MARNSKPNGPAGSPDRTGWLVPAPALVAGLLLLAQAARLWRLTADLPVVGDESIYLRWAEIVDHGGSPFVSLLDGKPPLSYWLYALTRRLWPEDPLYGPRLVSALAGTVATGAVFAAVRRLTATRTAVLAAALYALLPWAMLYDRLAYAESLVNLAGAAFVWASLRAFAAERAAWPAALLAGGFLALGMATKTTMLAFAPAPLLAAWLFGRRELRSNAGRLAAVYAAGAIPLALAAALTPEAPRGETSSAVLHKTHFFIPPSEMLASPLGALPENLPALGAFAAAYVTPAGLAAILLAGGVLLAERSRPAVFLAAVGALPILAQAWLIDRTFSRYPFPHLWPLLALAALGFERAWQVSRWRRRAAVGAALVFGWFGLASLEILRRPRSGLAPLDSGYFFGDAPNAGWGVVEAAGHIRRAARAGGSTLVLTDPIWGTPADALFAYLNRKDGIRVVEAWWIEEAPDAAPIPAARVEIWRSHYERVPGGVLDFGEYARIYYVTITDYRTREEVAARQAGAQLELSIPKPNRTQSLDVYRLR